MRIPSPCTLCIAKIHSEQVAMTDLLIRQQLINTHKLNDHFNKNLCRYVSTHGGEISGTVEDSKPHRLLIPSEGLEVELKLTFKSRGDFVEKLKNLIRQADSLNYTGEEAQGIPD